MRTAPLAVLLAWSLASAARADPPPAGGVVEVVVAGAPEDAAALGEVLGELAGRLGVTLRASRTDALDPSAVVTPDPAAPEAAFTPSLVPASAPPPPADAGPPGLPRRESRTLALDLGIGYEATGFADGAWVSHGPFAALGIALARMPLRPAFWLTAQARSPVDGAAVPIGVRLDQAVFRLLASVDVPLASALTMMVMLGAGLDVVRATPRLAAGESGRLESPSTGVFGELRGVVGFRLRLVGATDLLLAVGCDVDAESRIYVARPGGQRRVVLSPWVVRPLALLVMVTDVLTPASRAGTADE